VLCLNLSPNRSCGLADSFFGEFVRHRRHESRNGLTLQSGKSKTTWIDKESGLPVSNAATLAHGTL
jgi:hypothetical protein